jgi:hypothetical protein
LSAKQFLDDLAQPASASEARKPEISPRIAAWIEREAEDAHFTQIRRSEAERERREWQERRQRVIATRPAAPAPRARIVESASRRHLEMSSRQRSRLAPRVADHARERDGGIVAPTYVGGLTAAHAAMRDRSGN